MVFIICIIIFIFIALFIFYLFKKTETYKQLKNTINYPYYNLYTNIDHYRIGDLLKGYGKTPMIGNDKNLNLENGILKMHPNTLASKYLNIIRSNNNYKNNNYIDNLKILNNIISNKISDKKNICVVHLRIGDILDDKYYKNSLELINKKFFDNVPHDDLNYSKNLLPNWYIKSKKYYLDKINMLKKENIKNIIIIAASHINIGNYKNSSYFINLIKNLFENNNFNVELRLAKHPDKDIELVKNSKFFIAANGSYSDLLTEICKLNNNIVL